VKAVCGGYSIATSEASATIDDRAPWDHLDEQRLTAAFTEFLARNRNARGKPDHNGVRVDGAAEEGFAFNQTLKFRSGERYCCAEPRCHLGLHDPEVWRSLRELLGRHVLAGIPPMTVRRFRWSGRT
jgi:hypothetical protein